MVVPAATPVITPVVPTVATDGVPELHVPPPAVLLHVVVVPGQTEVVPDMVPAWGSALTVKLTVVVALPQLLVTE